MVLVFQQLKLCYRLFWVACYLDVSCGVALLKCLNTIGLPEEFQKDETGVVHWEVTKSTKQTVKIYLQSDVIEDI